MILHKFYLYIFIVIVIPKDSEKRYNILMPNIKILRLFISFTNTYILNFNTKIHNDINHLIVLIQIIINNPQKDHTFLTTSYNKS